MTDVSEQQRANLTQLAAYLRTLPADYPDFAMSSFTKDGYGRGTDPAHVAECGTAACAVGHGPDAGIAPLQGESWSAYSYRAFIPTSDSDDEPDPWLWCFGGSWATTDNTAHGAAARIEWMLQNGVPGDADEQRWDQAPLCYLSLLAAPRAGEGVNRG